MRLLVTRPREDALSLAAKLQARGHDVLIEPLIEIQPVRDAAVDLDGVQALLFTSANGVRAFSALAARRDLRVLTVGDATAAAARDAGFVAVESAGGDVEDLARLVIARLDPNAGVLFHAAGSALAGDLSGRLDKAGFTVRRAMLYRAETASQLSPAGLAALAENRIDGVVLFSPRTAKTFAAAIDRAGLGDRLVNVAAIGLSPAVIDALGAASWGRRVAAAAPNEVALLAVVDQLATTPAPLATVQRQPSSTMVGAAVLALVGLAVLAWAGLGGSRTDDTLAAQLAAAERQIATLSAAASAQADLARSIAAIDQRLAGVQGRLSELDARLANAPPPAPDRTGDLAEMRRRVDALAQRGEDPQAAAMVAETRRLATELARLQEAVAGVAGQLSERATARSSESAPALAALRQAVVSGGPFAAELLALQAVAGDQKETRDTLTQLVPFAERGVPTFEQLRRRFARVAAEIVRARPRDDAAPWWRPAADWAESLVTIRPVGNVPGESPPAIVARAEQRLADGDLAAAEAELGQLAGAAAAAAAGWRRDARARVLAERLVARLDPLLRGEDAAR